MPFERVPTLCRQPLRHHKQAEPATSAELMQRTRFDRSLPRAGPGHHYWFRSCVGLCRDGPCARARVADLRDFLPPVIWANTRAGDLSPVSSRLHGHRYGDSAQAVTDYVLDKHNKPLRLRGEYGPG